MTGHLTHAPASTRRLLEAEEMARLADEIRRARRAPRTLEVGEALFAETERAVPLGLLRELVGADVRALRVVVVPGFVGWRALDRDGGELARGGEG